MFIFNKEGKFKAGVKLETNEGLLLDGFKVIEGDKGMFVGWPSQPYEKDGQKKYQNIVSWDQNEELKKEVDDLILTEYYKELQSRGVEVREKKPESQAAKWQGKGKKATAALTGKKTINNDDDWN